MYDPIAEKYKMLVKGADNIIFERLKPTSKDEARLHIEAFVSEASVKGFRTLLFAMKELSDEEI